VLRVPVQSVRKKRLRPQVQLLHPEWSVQVVLLVEEAEPVPEAEQAAPVAVAVVVASCQKKGARVCAQLKAVTVMFPSALCQWIFTWLPQKTVNPREKRRVLCT